MAQFRDRGHNVVGLARNTSTETFIRALGAASRSGDLFHEDSLARAPEGADVIVHAATAIPVTAKPKPKDWRLNDRIRREGTRARAECTRRVGAKTLLIQGITWVARPTNQGPFDEDSPFHIDFVTKSAADMETIAREEGKKNSFGVAVLRCGWFYSADSAHTRYSAQQLAAHRFPIISKGDAVWAWIHADDAADAFVTTAESGRSGLWHVADDEPVTADYLRFFAHRLQAEEPRRVPHG